MPPHQPPDHPDTPLALTGERTLPGVLDERYWFERHRVAYRLATLLAPGRRVLDAGCGEGYGAAELAAAGAARVAAVDLDRRMIAHVRRTYPAVEAVAAEFGAMPFAPASFDLVVSLQVIEHVWDVPGYLAALREVTAPGGTLLVATPNRLTFSPGADAPTNPFHAREFSAGELTGVLRDADLAIEDVLGVHHGRVLRAVDGWVRLTSRGRLRDLPGLLGERAPSAWPAWVRAAVHRTSTRRFEVRADRLDASLDLVARCRRPAA